MWDGDLAKNTISVVVACKIGIHISGVIIEEF